MSEAQNGNKVKVHYTGKLEDGTVFDSSREREEPLEFTVGNQEVIPGVEKAVEGMSEGETKEVNIPSEEAYGEHDSNRVMDIPKSELPDDVDPQEGMLLQGQTGDGQTVRLQIVSVGEDTIKADANHPLAGKNLNFDLELMEVVE